jgi:beta-glucosidase
LSVTPDEESGTFRISFEVMNTGDVGGEEVAQVYVRDVESTLERPLKELKGFSKVRLEPGQKKKVELELGPAALSFYDPDRKQWVAEPGEFEVLAGSSSRDIRLKGALVLAPGR